MSTASTTRYKVSLQATASSLESGRALLPGEFINLTEEEIDRNRDLIDTSQLLLYEEYKPSGDELTGLAQDLDIEGRSTMSADQLRRAVKRAQTQRDKEGESQ